MNPLKSILVGVDFSPFSKTALKQAARIAKHNDARLQILHVIESLVVDDLQDALPSSAQDVRAQVVDHARKELENWVAEVDAPGVSATDVTVGVPIHELLLKVREVEADLLVLGAYGASGGEHGAGTTATKCVRKAATNVLLVHQEEMQPFGNVVACVDFSETSRRAVEEAVRVATQDRSRLQLLHVYYGPWHRLHYRAPTTEASPDFQKQYVAELQARVEDCRDSFAEELEGLEVECRLVDASTYGYGIVAHTVETKADLVVLGTRGRTNLRYVLLGSTAERVLRAVHCSVLAVKPPGFTTVVS